jgi:serine/threonine protein kinase
MGRGRRSPAAESDGATGKEAAGFLTRMDDVSQREDPATQRIGRYTVLEPLGEGGMARVFIAQRDGGHDICVLKRMHVQFEQSSVALKRFQREAHIASFLDHPAIARILGAGVEDGSFCLAMEYIAGETVERLVERSVQALGSVPFDVAMAIALRMLEGLAYAHAMKDGEGKPLGIVHRDLSPRNMMVSYDGAVKLIDFGIARGSVDDFKTAPGVLMGTPYYMSPEQAQATEVDRRSDLYTAGAVLFELLAGRRLVRTKGRAQILLSVVKEGAEPPSSINPRVPSAVDAVVLKALEKRREDRFQDAGSFREALLRAAPRAACDAGRLGAFIRELFPDGERRAARFKSIANRSQESMPIVEPTKVAASSTGEHFFAETPRGPLSSPHEMTPADVLAPTKTGVVAAARSEVLEPEAPPNVTDAGAPPPQSFSIVCPRKGRGRLEAAVGTLALVVLGVLGWIVLGLRGPIERAPISSPPIEKGPAALPPIVEPHADPPIVKASEPAQDTLGRGEREAPNANERHRPRRTRAHEKADERKIAAPAPETAPPMTPQPGPRYAAIHRELERSRAAPKDVDLFFRVHRAIDEEAQRLPQRAKVRVSALLNSAATTMDVEELSRALSVLEKSSAPRE